MSMGTQTVDALLTALASKRPAPGGGAAAALVGATAAATVNMVVAYSFTSALAPHHDELHEAARTLENARRLCLRLGDEDAEAYAAVAELWKLPPGDARRGAEMPAAAMAASQVPLAVMAAATDTLRLIDRLTPITNPNLRSDLSVGAILADASARAAAECVRINLPLLVECGIEGGVWEEAERLLSASSELLGAVLAAIRPSD